MANKIIVHKIAIISKSSKQFEKLDKLMMYAGAKSKTRPDGKVYEITSRNTHFAYWVLNPSQIKKEDRDTALRAYAKGAEYRYVGKTKQKEQLGEVLEKKRIRKVLWLDDNIFGYAIDILPHHLERTGVAHLGDAILEHEKVKELGRKKIEEEEAWWKERKPELEEIKTIYKTLTPKGQDELLGYLEERGVDIIFFQYQELNIEKVMRARKKVFEEAMIHEGTKDGFDRYLSHWLSEAAIEQSPLGGGSVKLKDVQRFVEKNPRYVKKQK